MRLACLQLYLCFYVSLQILEVSAISVNNSSVFLNFNPPRDRPDRVRYENIIAHNLAILFFLKNVVRTGGVEECFELPFAVILYRLVSAEYCFFNLNRVTV